MWEHLGASLTFSRPATTPALSAVTTFAAQRALGVPNAATPGCGTNLSQREAWRFGLACMTVAYFLVALLAAASTLKGHIFIGLVAGLTVFSAPDSLRRWARTRRAFGRLPIHIRQQLVAKWVLIAALASAFLLLVLRKGE